MTRYVIPGTMLDASSDPDGDVIIVSHLSLGAGSTPTLMDWVATPVKTFTAFAGQIEITKDGAVIYDDLGNGSTHPPSGSLGPLTVRFKVTDARGAVSAAVADYALTLNVTAAGDTTAPTPVSVSPTSGVAVDGVLSILWSEAIQAGSGNLVLRNMTTNTTIETRSLPADLGTSITPAAGKIFVQGSTLYFRPTSDLPTGTQVSLRPAAGIIKDLSNNNNAAVTNDSLALTTAGTGSGLSFPDDPRGFRGQTNKSYGTTSGVDYDLLVDPAGGGTHTTIGAANTAAVAGNRVAIKAGTYYEQLTLKSNVTYQAYGTDRPLVSAQTADLTGFAQCTSADSGVLGPVLGVNGSPVYKKTGLLKSSFPISNLRGLNVTENNRPIFNAQDRPNKAILFDREDEETYNNPITNGGAFMLNGTVVSAAKASFNQIKDPAIINSSRYTDAQLLKADMWVFAEPNEVYKMTVSASDVANNTITLSGSQLVNNDTRKRYALGNMGFAMVAGTWIYVDGGGSTFDLYVYPTNPANITKIAYAARVSAFTLPSGAATNVSVKGINFVGGTGSGLAEGSLLRDSDNTTFSTGTFVENCRFTAIENIGQLHFAALHLARANNFTVQYCTFEYNAAHGIWPTGSSQVQTGALMRRNAFIYCGSAGAKAYSQSKYMFVLNYHFHCGYRAHGNLGNVYIAGTDAIWRSNEFDECQGYLTGKTVNMHVSFNMAPCFNKKAAPEFRKFENQGGSGTSYFYNNSAPPVSNAAPGTNSMSMDWGFPGQTLYLYNNVAHGMSRPDDQGGTVTAQYNLVTNTGYSGANAGNLDASDFTGGAGKFDTTNVLNTSLAAIYRDHLNKDYRPASSSSPLLTMGTFDITTAEALMKSTFPAIPAEDWTLDAYGGTINLGSLKIGAVQSNSYP